MSWSLCFFYLLVLVLPAFALPMGVDPGGDASLALADNLMPVDSLDLSMAPGGGQLISEYGDPVAAAPAEVYGFRDVEKRLEDRWLERARLPETAGTGWSARALTGGARNLWSGGPGRSESMPEPGTFALLAMGMFAVALLLRSRRAT